MLEENKIVNGLWIGNKLGNLELLTIHSFINFGHDFYLWIYEPIKTPLPPQVFVRDANEIIPKENIFNYKHSNQYGHGKGSYAGFSDIFRYALLYKYGGWWVDMDVTCLSPLNYEYPFVFRKHHVFDTVGNIMKCPKNSILMKLCYEEAYSSINSENKDWNKPIIILNKYIKELSLQNYIIDFTNEDKWLFVKKLLKSEHQLPSHLKVIHWVNEEWRRHKIKKEYAIPGSFYYLQLSKYNINTLNINLIDKFILSFKLSNIYSLWLYLIKPQSWNFILKSILNKFFSKKTI
jgi:hypothetical protein